MTEPQNLVGARIDCHVHSRYSPDGRGSYSDLAARARRRGLSGFVASDHNVFPNMGELKDAAGKDLLIIPGEEVSTQDGHCLAIGIQSLVPAGRPLPETLELIREAGGVGVPSHPHRLLHGAGPRALDAARKHLVAIEVFNAQDGNGIRSARSRRYARAHGLGGTGGSDTHRVIELGNAYTVFPNLPPTVDDAVAQIERRSTWGEGRGTSVGIKFLQKFKTVSAWAARGFRPM